VSTPYNAAPGYIEVPALRPTAPKSSLLNAAEVITDNSIRWEGGYFQVPALSPRYGLYVYQACDSVELSQGDSNCDPILVDPFYIISHEDTSAFNIKKKDLYTSTFDNLISGESYTLEERFVFGNGVGSNPYLLDPANNFSPVTAIGAAPYSLFNALGWMERTISERYLAGLKPMIIVSKRIMAHLVRHTVLRREGNLWLSPSDIPVVSIASFAGTGPAGQAATLTQEFIYGVAGVQIRRSDVIFIPEKVEPTEDNPFGYPSSAINRLTNDISVTSQRYYGVSFVTTDDSVTPDKAYPVIYAQVDLTL